MGLVEGQRCPDCGHGAIRHDSVRVRDFLGCVICADTGGSCPRAASSDGLRIIEVDGRQP